MTLLLLLTPAPAQLFPGSFGPGAVIDGPTVDALGGPADPDWTPRARLAVYERDGTFVTNLPDSFGRTFTLNLDGTGTGRFSVAASDAAAAELTHGRVVLFFVDGVAKFAMLLRNIDTIALAQAEEVDEVIDVIGPSTFEVLDEGIVDASSGPTENPDVRPFNLASPAGTGSVVILGVSTNASSILVGPQPGDWPDPIDAAAPPATRPLNFSAEVDIDPGKVARWVSAPGTGPLYYVHQFTTSDADASYRLDVGMSGPGAVYVDGALAKVERRQYARRRYSIPMTLADGTHTVAVRVDEPADPAVDPAAIMRVLKLDDSGSASALLAYSAPPASPGSSTIGARRSATPPRSLTAGAIVATLIAEAQARGCFPEVSLSFDGAVDSLGEPWPAIEEFSAAVGDDTVLSVAKKLTEAGYGWFRMAPGQLRLDGFAALADTPSVTLAAGVNLAELKHEGAG